MSIKSIKFSRTCLIALIIMFIACGCSLNSKKTRISEYLNINIDSCKFKSESDSHSFFLGDGEYFAKIICTNNDDNEIKSKWEKLPLASELQKVMEIKMCEEDGCKNAYERYSIPNIQNGYYYFLDRHSKSVNNHSYEELNNSSSYNFSLGIYDSTNKILYYYELDM